VRPLVVLAALLWVLLNLAAAYGLLVTGLAAKTAAKGATQTGMLLAAAALIALFALLLAAQTLRLLLSRQPRSEP
jgi:hypothetical protein